VFEKDRQLVINGRARAIKYNRILENEVHLETNLDEVYKDLIDELGGYIRPTKVSQSPIYLWFYEIKTTPYWKALANLADMNSFNMEINDSGGLTFDFLRPKLMEDLFEIDDPARPVMWREWSEVGVSSGAAETDWSIVSGDAVSTADSYLFHDKTISEDFELEIGWERPASLTSDDSIYFYHQDMDNFCYSNNL
jgi:hypothetical protein